MRNTTIRDVYEEGYAIAAGLCAAPVRWLESSICPGGLIDGVQLASTVVPDRRTSLRLTTVEFLTVMEVDLVSTEDQEIIRDAAASDRKLRQAIHAAAVHASLPHVAEQVEVILLGIPMYGIFTAQSDEDEPSSSGMGAGAVFGIILLVLLGLSVIIGGFVFWRRRGDRGVYREGGHFNDRTFTPGGPRPFSPFSNQDDFRL